MSRAFVAAAGLLLGAAILLAPSPVGAQSLAKPPQLSASERGATIEDVTIKTYGVTKPSVVRRYLSLHEGSILEQAGLNRDFDNLARLAGKESESKELQGAFDRQRTLVNNSFWLPDKKRFAFALDKDNHPLDEASVLSTVPMWFGLLDEDKSA